MTGSTLTTLVANPAPSPETSTLSSMVSTAAASATTATTTAATPTAASATAASPARNAWTSNFSSIVLRLSSFVYRPIIRSSSFRNFFYSKIFSIESSPRWGEGRVRGPLSSIVFISCPPVKIHYYRVAPVGRLFFVNFHIMRLVFVLELTSEYNC